MTVGGAGAAGHPAVSAARAVEGTSNVKALRGRLVPALAGLLVALPLPLLMLLLRLYTAAILSLRLFAFALRPPRATDRSDWMSLMDQCA